MGTKPDKRIRRTFPTPDLTAQNAFLCRAPRDRVYERALQDALRGERVPERFGLAVEQVDYGPSPVVVVPGRLNRLSARLVGAGAIPEPTVAGTGEVRVA
jgi:hypothetical protein